MNDATGSQDRRGGVGLLLLGLVTFAWQSRPHHLIRPLYSPP
ncbi:MAG: hypothetical protein ACLFU8_03135 [Anaerolineales bacterium]